MPRSPASRAVAAIVLTLAALVTTPAGADDSWTPVRSFRVFTKALWRGLPQSTVASMAQETDGVLWIGTFDGLASFDGRDLVPVPAAPNAPVRGVLTAMVARRQGGIAVTSPAGVHLSERGAWRLVPSQRTALALAEAKGGTLWMADVDGAAWTLDGEAWQRRSELREPALALSAAPDGSVWVATATGATRLHDGAATRSAATFPAAPSAILAALDGRVWIATLGGTLHWMQPGDPTWHQVELENWPTGRFRCLGEDRRGRIWAGTLDGWLAFGSPEKGWSTWGPHNGPFGGLMSIVADREGSVWFGMNGGGMAQWLGEEWSHRTGFGQPGKPGERFGMWGMSRGAGEHSMLVAGFAIGVLKLRDGKPPQVWTAADGITEHARMAVEPEPGTIWAATRFGVFESKGGSRFQHVLKLPSGFATGLFKSPQGRWYAATSTAGVYGRVGERWEPVPGISSALDDPYVRGMTWTSSGELWVGTLRGVSVFRDEKVVERITQKTEPALPESVNAVVETADGEVWAGGIGGIGVRKGGVWRRLGATDGLPGPTVYSLGRAPDGAIWAGGSAGIGRFQDGRWTTWDSRSGLLEDECNLNGMVIEDDGSVYVGTMGSLARFDPTVEPLPPPPLKLRWLEAPAVAGDGTAPLDGRELRLRWSAAWLGARPVEYRTRLARLRDSWSEPTKHALIDVQNLAPGEWPVEVQARVEGSEAWTEPLRLRVSVKPYWHETLPARAGMVAAAGLLALGLFRLRVRSLRRHAAMLEATVHARTAELAEKVKALEVSEQRAQDASRAKTTFLANMSHELRTPLNGVLGFAQLMARRPGRDLEDRRQLSVILRSGEHLLGLINDVLSLARIEAGGATLNQSTFDASAVVMSVEQMVRPRAEQKGLALRTVIAPGLPRQVTGDPGKLRQVLLNLVGNAVKFTERGSVIVRVSWSEGRGVFEVEDTGPGVAAHEVSRLFEPFVQTESGRLAREGTGLGLALSQDLARLMGGAISAVSEAGRGSTFRLELAMPAASALALSAEALEARRVKRLAPGQQPWRLLVVDDVKENRDVLTGLLASVGFEVRSAQDGEEAIAAWQEWRPHLIWMDKRMPRLDGIEATRRIRAQPDGGVPDVKIIVLSASALDHERQEIMDSGCDDFVSKPFKEATIFSRIAEHLGVRYEYEDVEGGAADRLAEGVAHAAPEALPIVRRLAALVEGGDLAATEACDALKRALAPRVPGLVGEIEACLDRMDFDAAGPLVARLGSELAQAAATEAR